MAKQDNKKKSLARRILGAIPVNAWIAFFVVGAIGFQLIFIYPAKHHHNHRIQFCLTKQ